MKLVDLIHSHDLVDRPPVCSEEFRFELDSGEEWTFTFMPTVPIGGEHDEEIYGDLFDCRIEAIDFGSRPIVRGGNREREILNQLGGWIDATIDRERQETLLYARFTRMTQEMAWHKHLIWFYRALERRRIRVETD